jgi:hypothetical protein
MPLVDDTMVVEENLFDESVGQSPMRSTYAYSWCDHVLRTYQSARRGVWALWVEEGQLRREVLMVWRVRMEKRAVLIAVKVTCQPPRR